MLDHRVYRTAFLPALVAVFVLAFSLADVPRAQTTRSPSFAFDGARAFGTGNIPPRNSLTELAAAFPNRRPGSPGDTRLADRVAGALDQSGFTNGQGVKRTRIDAETVDGDVDLENVLAVRQGLSSRTVVVVAHRDALRGPAVAELSGTAVLMELARVLAGRDLSRTVMLASVSGGTGGFDGARAVVDEAPGPVDAVIVLGDLAGTTPRRPFVVPYGTGHPGAPASLERTAQAALRAELGGQDLGRVRGAVQALRRALPLSTGEQGVIDAPAVLLSNSGEARPRAGEAVDRDRFEAFGRATLRTITATLEARGNDPFPSADGIVFLKRLVPTWAVRLLVLTLLLPALVTAFDAFFRVRRRGLRMGAWTAWTASFALPFLLAWGWARLLGLLGAADVLGAPAPAGVPLLETTGWIAMASVVVIALGVAFGVRPLLLRSLGRFGDPSAGAAAAAAMLVLAILTLLVWVFNPWAAAILLPAAHAWLLVTAPERRLPRPVVIASVATGLVLPVLVLVYYARSWDAGPWALFNLVAGGSLGVGAAFAFALFAGLGCATVVILRAKRRVAASAPEERPKTRGPRSYAGPGSLGGTESALR